MVDISGYRVFRVPEGQGKLGLLSQLTGFLTVWLKKIVGLLLPRRIMSQVIGNVRSQPLNCLYAYCLLDGTCIYESVASCRCHRTRLG